MARNVLHPAVHFAHKTTVVAVFAAAADAVLVALEVHPATIAGNPKS